MFQAPGPGALPLGVSWGHWSTTGSLHARRKTCLQWWVPAEHSYRDNFFGHKDVLVNTVCGYRVYWQGNRTTIWDSLRGFTLAFVLGWGGVGSTT